MGVIWAMITGTAVSIVYMFNTFVSAATFNDFQTDIYYSQFYELLEKKADAEDEGRDGLADELARQMERLKAKICEEDPEWERCNEAL
jgi:Rod binding domain-containing protein